MNGHWDRRNVLVGCITTVILAVFIFVTVTVCDGHNEQVSRDHIAACRTIQGNLDRAICLGRQP